MKTIALINNKGGVGKTTVAINLSTYLSRRGRKILLVDLDAQCSAGISLGFSRNTDGVTMSDVLLKSTPTKEGIRNTYIKNLDIILAEKELTNFDRVHNNIYILKKCIKQVSRNYDYLFLDCPPSSSLLTMNALISADKLIIPVNPDYLSLEGLTLLTKDILEPDSPFKILINNVDVRRRITIEVINHIRKHYKNKVFKAEIKANVKITESSSWHKSIFDYSGKSTGADNYKELGKEFLLWSR